MNDKEYLNQISSSVRPEKKPKMSFMSSPIFKALAIGVIAFVMIVVLGSILGGNKGDLENSTIALKLHLDNTSEIVSKYQKSIKSSDLRSSSASVYSVLTNTSREVTDYLTAKYSYKSGSGDKKIIEEATLNKDGLDTDLADAKINGTLDRIFALKMKYEISLLMAEETNIYNTTGDTTLKNIMNSSYNSLETLYNKLNDFSETK